MRLDSANHVRAFTRLDVAALLGALTVLLVLVLPVIAGDRARASRVQCLNNLRQIGIGMALWGDDNRGEPPHHVPYTEGGTRSHPLAANAWVHFSYISNGLPSAKVLFCPSDTGTPARDFGNDPSGGYLHPNFRNQATSYLLAFNFYADDVRIQSGDRNVYSQGTLSSSYFNYSSYVAMNPLNREFRWMPGLHGDVGNLLFSDGQVRAVDTAGLRAAAELGADFAAGAHNWRFLLPR
jgi:hypothetical protein